MIFPFVAPVEYLGDNTPACLLSSRHSKWWLRRIFAIVPVQTNLALYAQLHAAGYSAQELRRVQRTYDLATEIFNGAYRGSGKPFVCHAVGTASVAAQIGLGIVPVVAGMLHAAFDLGVFPNGKRGDRQAHRMLVAGRAGQDVVDLVLAYRSLAFCDGAVERLLHSPPTAEPERTLALLRLANEVDDMLDEGLFVAQKYPAATQRAGNCARIARLLGEERLAATIERLAEVQGPAPWVAALELGPKYSYRLLPRLRAYLRLRRKRGTRLIG